MRFHCPYYILEKLLTRKELTEVSLSRLLTHVKEMDTGGFAMISASKNPKTTSPEVNNKNTETLRKYLISLHVSFFPLRGGWKDEETGQEYTEESFFISNISKEVAKKLGKRFDQDAVLWGSPKDGMFYIKKDGTEQALKGELNSVNISQYWSQVKGKKFAFESWLKHSPGGMSDRAGWSFELSGFLDSKYGVEEADRLVEDARNKEPHSTAKIFNKLKGK
jgi:hypothetical protein